MLLLKLVGLSLLIFNALFFFLAYRQNKTLELILKKIGIITDRVRKKSSKAWSCLQFLCFILLLPSLIVEGLITRICDARTKTLR